MHVNDLLKIAVDSGASDLHLKVGTFPMMRVRGSLVPAMEDKRLEHEEMVSMAAAVLPVGYRDKFKEHHEVDLAYSVAGLGRFRCNAFQQRGTIGMVFRVIPRNITSIDDLALPPVLKKIAKEERGLVLVTGATGSGKTTTLAAMIDEINATRTAHIMTIEDPIEYLHRDKRSVINQREIGVDTDLVLDGAAQRAASGSRTSSWSAKCATSRPSRPRSSPPRPATWSSPPCTRSTRPRPSTASSRCSRRTSRSRSACSWPACCAPIVSQRLMPKPRGEGRVPAVEVLTSTAFIRDCIADREKTHLIHGAIAQGTSQYGMQTFDQSIFRLYEQGLVELEEALRWASNVDDFKLKVQGISNTGEMARDQMAGVGSGTQARDYEVWLTTPI